MLQQILLPYTSYLIISGINQVDQYSDKLRGSALLRGWEETVTWKHNLNLLDILFTGPRFTWSNNREDDHLIMELLDRAYASVDWMQEFPQMHLRNFPIIHSDHALILLKTSNDIRSMRRPYQIENWSHHYKEVQEMLREIWGLCIIGSPLYTLSRRLELLRTKLKS